jgi:hypothetical protein
MNFRESTITKPLAILLTVAIVNITAFAAVILDGNARPTRMEIPTAIEYTKNINFTPNKAFTYGVDKDKVAFAKANNSDATGRFLDLSPNHFKLQITRQNKVGGVQSHIGRSDRNPIYDCRRRYPRRTDYKNRDSEGWREPGKSQLSIQER